MPGLVKLAAPVAPVQRPTAPAAPEAAVQAMQPTARRAAPPRQASVSAIPAWLVPIRCAPFISAATSSGLRPTALRPPTAGACRWKSANDRRIGRRHDLALPSRVDVGPLRLG